ncbi:MAG TPA: hypothetical protein VNK24_06600 [Elusimicrobiota bacterium]|nr:hypothetical protein [Elusimicrobiota bacterium]
MNPRSKPAPAITRTELQPNAGIVSVQTPGPALVIFNDNYAPGWKVFVNGKRAALISVDHLFMGAEVPARGSYTVMFEFRPDWVIAAILLPYAALLILGSIIFVIYP